MNSSIILFLMKPRVYITIASSPIIDYCTLQISMSVCWIFRMIALFLPTVSTYLGASCASVALASPEVVKSAKVLNLTRILCIVNSFN